MAFYCLEKEVKTNIHLSILFPRALCLMGKVV